MLKASESRNIPSCCLDELLFDGTFS